MLTRFIEKLAGAKSGIEALRASLTSQRVEFERLVMVYKDLHHNQNRSTEENIKYQKTINDLMSKYPNYLGEIDLEKGAWKDIAKAIDFTRERLQEWINLKIKEAIIDKRKDEMIKLLEKEGDATLELETLQAEFVAGTKSRTTQRPGVAQPLSPGYRANVPVYDTVESSDAKREKRLQKKIEKYQSEYEALNKEIERRVALIAGVEIDPPSTEGGGEGGGGSSGTGHSQTEIDSIMQEIEAYRVLREANYNEELAQIATLEKEYALKLKAVAGNADAERDLAEKRDWDISEIRKKMHEQNQRDEATHYDKLKFYAEGYYEWKAERIREEAERSGSPQSWVDDQMAQLDREQKEWDRRAVLAFEEQYEAEMTHLAQLRDLGLATYSEVAEKSWGYYRALKAILEVDGEISEEEKELLAIYQKRAQAAQLAVNRESDVARYYNEIKFLDEGYYEWKKARIEEDVRTMDLAEEQKAALVKARLEGLDKELEGFEGDKTLFGRILDSIGVPQDQQGKLVGAFQDLANRIAGIFSQMYNNLGLQRDKALTDLEKRAKTERMTEVWLAKEKEKINEEYEKKQRALKRTEQKMQIASATVNTLEGITNALTIKPAWLAPVLAASVGALGFAQVKLIADQKFASGGLFRGKGSTTSDSNIIAVSDHEYIVSADRVKRFGVGFFDALNFGGAEQIRKALNSFRMPALAPVPVPVKTSGYAAGGQVHSGDSKPANIQMNVTLKCDSKELARAVARGNKKIIST